VSATPRHAGSVGSSPVASTNTISAGSDPDTEQLTTCCDDEDAAQERPRWSNWSSPSWISPQLDESRQPLLR
jgi:hypothetical protein